MASQTKKPLFSVKFAVPAVSEKLTPNFASQLDQKYFIGSLRIRTKNGALDCQICVLLRSRSACLQKASHELIVLSQSDE